MAARRCHHRVLNGLAHLDCDPKKKRKKLKQQSMAFYQSKQTQFVCRALTWHHRLGLEDYLMNAIRLCFRCYGYRLEVAASRPMIRRSYGGHYTCARLSPPLSLSLCVCPRRCVCVCMCVFRRHTHVVCCYRCSCSFRRCLCLVVSWPELGRDVSDN